MPLYEFVCKKCGISFEALTRGEGSYETCPECGAAGAERQVSVPNFCVKGSCANPLPPKEIKEVEKKKVKRNVLADWQCPECGKLLEDEFRDPGDALICPECGSEMKQLVGRVGWELKYDPKTDKVDWQGNTSQYWSAVKEARRRGENVKGFNEK